MTTEQTITTRMLSAIADVAGEQNCRHAARIIRLACLTGTPIEVARLRELPENERQTLAALTTMAMARLPALVKSEADAALKALADVADSVFTQTDALSALPINGRAN